MCRVVGFVVVVGAMVVDALLVGSGEPVGAGLADGVAAAVVFVVGSDVADGGVEACLVVVAADAVEFGGEGGVVGDCFEVGPFAFDVPEEALDPGLVGGRAGPAGALSNRTRTWVEVSSPETRASIQRRLTTSTIANATRRAAPKCVRSPHQILLGCQSGQASRGAGSRAGGLAAQQDLVGGPDTLRCRPAGRVRDRRRRQPPGGTEVC